MPEIEGIRRNPIPKLIHSSSVGCDSSVESQSQLSTNSDSVGGSASPDVSISPHQLITAPGT